MSETQHLPHLCTGVAAARERAATAAQRLGRVGGRSAAGSLSIEATAPAGAAAGGTAPEGSQPRKP